ncbi:MAG: glycosyltransferase family 9 protein [Candidatus Aenigmatarchaeota archaeon]
MANKNLNSIKTGLIIHTAGLGDFIMFTPVIKLLKEAFERINLYVFTSDKFSYELVKFYCEEDYIAKVFYGNFVFNKIDLLKFLLSSFLINPDFILTTTAFNSIKGELIYLILGNKRLARLTKDAKLLKNFIRYEFNKKHQVEQNLIYLERALNLRFEYSAAKPFLPSRLSKQALNGLDNLKILIHPGSSKGGSIRRYPLEKFIKIAKILRDDGFEVAFILGPAEKDLSSFIDPEFRVFCVYNLEDCCKIITNYSFFLNSDSGLGHLAAALNRYVFTIFGPANPDLSKPYSPKVTVIRSPFLPPCSPCIYPPVNTKKCGNRICLISIDENFVATKIKNFAKEIKNNPNK